MKIGREQGVESLILRLYLGWRACKGLTEKLLEVLFIALRLTHEIANSLIGPFHT